MTMKKALKVVSVICFLVALFTLVFGIIALSVSSRNWFAGYALFNFAASGTFMGFIGNLFGILLTMLCFGAMGYFGLKGNTKGGLIWSACAIVLALISLIIVIAIGAFTFGDLLITVLPVVYLVLIFKSTD